MTYDNRGQAAETSTPDTSNRQLENSSTTMDSNQTLVFFIIRLLLFFVIV